MEQNKKKLQEENKKITFEQFKEKVKIDHIGFAMSEEDWELCQDKTGIIPFAIGDKMKKAMYDKCKEEEILPLIVMGMKLEFGLARNNKVLLNHKEEDIKELRW